MDYDIALPVNWDAVYWKYMPDVFRFFCYQVGDEALAEDLTATTFVKVWKARSQYDQQRGELTTWLFTIARNTMTDYFRRKRDNLPLELVEIPIRASEIRQLEQAVEQLQDIARLRALMELLSEREQELIIFKYGAGLTNRLIAELTDISESNVGTILHRAVNRLRAAWETNEYE